jgi:N-acetylglucosaminyldiphosphoundecaprenol N-acetyl-beta-D-mannosaminyltransferase
VEVKFSQVAKSSDHILGMRVDLTSYIASTKRIIQWAREGRSAMVCLGNVHMVMTAYDEPEFAKVLDSADLVTHDGMPLVWALRLLGHAGIERVYGPHLMLFVCQAASKRGIPIGLYGGTPEVLADLVSKLQQRYPGLQIPFQVSPPFRPTTKEEDDRDLKALRDSGARILFVGIGCPKQELWIHRNKRRFPGPMLGVGQAFDIHSGHTRMAPRWIQNLGMEWFYRLCTEPRRLWKRYLKNNPRYLALVAMQLFDRKIGSTPEGQSSALYRKLGQVIAPRLRQTRPREASRRK